MGGIIGDTGTQPTTRRMQLAKMRLLERPDSVLPHICPDHLVICQGPDTASCGVEGLGDHTGARHTETLQKIG